MRMEAGKGKDYKKQSKESASIHPVYILCTEHAGSTIHVRYTRLAGTKKCIKYEYNILAGTSQCIMYGYTRPAVTSVNE